MFCFVLVLYSADMTTVLSVTVNQAQSRRLEAEVLLALLDEHRSVHAKPVHGEQSGIPAQYCQTDLHIGPFIERLRD